LCGVWVEHGGVTRLGCRKLVGIITSLLKEVSAGWLVNLLVYKIGLSWIVFDHRKEVGLVAPIFMMWSGKAGSLSLIIDWAAWWVLELIF